MPTPVPMLALGGDDDDDENPALIPNPAQTIDHAPPECNSTPLATPPIIHIPLPAPVEPSAFDLHRISHILCSSGE